MKKIFNLIPLSVAAIFFALLIVGQISAAVSDGVYFNAKLISRSTTDSTLDGTGESLKVATNIPLGSDGDIVVRFNVTGAPSGSTCVAVRAVESDKTGEMQTYTEDSATANGWKTVTLTPYSDIHGAKLNIWLDGCGDNDNDDSTTVADYIVYRRGIKVHSSRE